MKLTVGIFIAASFAVAQVAEQHVLQQCLQNCRATFILRVLSYNMTDPSRYSGALNARGDCLDCALGCYGL